MKRVISVFVLAIFVLSATFIFGACHSTDEKLDLNKTIINVSNCDLGYGSIWLEEVKVRFERDMADYYNPKNGKTGVQVIINKSSSQNVPISTMQSNKNQVFFIERGTYNAYATECKVIKEQGGITPLYNITEWVTGENPFNPGKHPILDNLDDKHAGAFTAVNGDFWGLPHYEGISGAVYDLDLFADRELFIAKDRTPTSPKYTGDITKASTGPDGLYGTLDDGLPMTWQEFYKLCEHMKNNLGMSPFAWMTVASSIQTYSNYMMNAIVAQTAGEALSANYTLEGTVKQVTGFDSNENPIYSTVTVTPDNGYVITQQLGRYYAAKLMEKIYDNNWLLNAPSASNTDCQEFFINGLTGAMSKDAIGFLSDGCWWHNEATMSGAIRRADSVLYPAKERRYGWVAFPGTYDLFDENGDKIGTLVYGEAFDTDFNPATKEYNSQGQLVVDGKVVAKSKGTLLDTLDSLCIVNGYMDDALVDAVKAFVQFCYSEEELANFTICTGATRGLQYSIPESKVELMSNFSQFFWERRANSTVIYPHSNTSVSLRYEAILTSEEMTWKTTTTPKICTSPYNAIFENKYRAKYYFENLRISPEVWENSYKIK